MNAQQGGPTRIRRVTRACDRCHQTNAKCSPGPEPSVCRKCFEFRSPCTYNRSMQRRGPKPTPGPAAAAISARVVVPKALASNSQWEYQPTADHAMIEGLVRAYHSIVYPIFPLFHWPTFTARVQHRHYETDQAFCATVMAVCAIVAGRQAKNVDPMSSQAASSPASTPPSQAFYESAMGAFPHKLSDAQGFEFKRAKVLMAIACIQFGWILEHQTHLGEYVALACNAGFHNEKRWDRELTEIHRQERRRLFWSAYTLEVFSAITWDGIVRFREQQSNVRYPAEVYDEDITEHGITLRIDPSFLQGWNHTTDMYRVLEHLVGRLKNRRSEPDALSSMFTTTGPSASAIIGYLEDSFSRLPPIYRSAQVMTGDDRQDCFGFQAANIAITLQTVKLALAAAEDQSVARNCEIAGELLDVLAAIPTSYIMAISAPMLHHLASCGHLLANAIQSPLSQWSMIQIRNVLIAMIDLLSGLERTLSLGSDVSVRLRGHVAQIETYMEQAAKTAQKSEVFHSVVPQYTQNTTMAVPVNYENDCGSNTSGNVVFSEIDHLVSGHTDLWSNDSIFDWPSDHQTALQADLTENWPFDFGGGMYDFLGQATDALSQMDGNDMENGQADQSSFGGIYGRDV